MYIQKTIFQWYMLVWYKYTTEVLVTTHTCAGVGKVSDREMPPPKGLHIKPPLYTATAVWHLRPPRPVETTCGARVMITPRTQNTARDLVGGRPWRVRVVRAAPATQHPTRDGMTTRPVKIVARPCTFIYILLYQTCERCARAGARIVVITRHVRVRIWY